MTQPQAKIGRPRGDRDIPELLIASARRLFAEQGFAATSVQEIVEAANVTKGGMYHYFHSKDDLLHEIYSRLLRLQTERLQIFLGSGEPLSTRLYQAAADVVMTSIIHIDSVTVFVRSLHELGTGKQKEVRAERRLYHESFRSLICEGQRDGIFDAAADADLALNYFFGAVHYLSTWYQPDGLLTPRTISKSYAQWLVASLADPAACNAGPVVSRELR